MRMSSGKFAWLLGLLLLTTALAFPAAPVERLLFLEDACWTLSWAIIAARAFREKRSGFPPGVISLTLAVELYLFYHYTWITNWPWNSWLLLNYFLWPVMSGFNVVTVISYSRDEFVPGGKITPAILRLMGETSLYFGMFAAIAATLPPHLVMVVLGLTAIFMISLHFVIMAVYRKGISDQSLAGNFFRFLGGVLCFYLNTGERGAYLGSMTYLRYLMTAIVILDLIFLSQLVASKRNMSSRSAQPG